MLHHHDDGLPAQAPLALTALVVDDSSAARAPDRHCCCSWAAGTSTRRSAPRTRCAWPPWSSPTSW